MAVTQLDPQKQKQAGEYARRKRQVAVLGMAFFGVYTLAWLVLGWSSFLRNTLMAITNRPVLLVPLFVMIYGGIYGLLSLPMDYYAEFSLPHHFNLSNQRLKDWFIDRLKGVLVGLPILILVVEVIYALLGWQPNTWWLFLAGFLLIFNVLLANLAPVLLKPLFNKYNPLGDEYVELAEKLTKLAKKCGTHVRGVYQFDMSRRTKEANAALTGFGRTRRVILGDTLLKEFSIDEIETVMAHELGHNANKDILLGIAFQTLITLAGLYCAQHALRIGAVWSGLQGPADPASLPLLALIIGLFEVVTIPLGNAYSRWRERMADEYSLKMTGNGMAYASALTRLANQNLAEVDPEPWVEWLFYSHPSLKRRIKMAEDFAAQKVLKTVFKYPGS
jgi:STE24 endopeptidase